MILVLIGAILLSSRYLIKSYNDVYVDLVDYLMAILYGCVFGGFFGFLVACTLPMELEDKTYELKIECLQDYHSVSGKFFLGSGKVKDVMKHTFYYESNGSYRLMQVDCNKSEIRYTNGTPKVKITKKYPSDSFMNLMAFDFKCFSKTYVIEVPFGTIKTDYTLDAL